MPESHPAPSSVTLAKRTHRVGTIDGAPFFLEVEVIAGRLSLSGTYPHGGGQCLDALLRVDSFAPGWSAPLRDQVYALWSRWHLNDMRAGTPAQESHLRDSAYSRDRDGPDHYAWACATLRAANLYTVPVTPALAASALGGLPPGATTYAYGTRWLREELPAEVVALLSSLPSGITEEPLEVMASDFLAAHSLTYTSAPGPVNPNLDAPPEGSSHWSCTLASGPRSVTFPFTQGPAHRTWKRSARSAFLEERINPHPIPGKRVPYLKTAYLRALALAHSDPIPPSASDLLSCLSSDCSSYDNSASFPDWCANSGLNPDSISDARTYRTLGDQAKALRHFLGTTAYAALLSSF